VLPVRQSKSSAGIVERQLKHSTRGRSAHDTHPHHGFPYRGKARARAAGAVTRKLVLVWRANQTGDRYSLCGYAAAFAVPPDREGCEGLA